MEMFDYNECEARFGSAYRIRSAIADGRVFRLAKGVYSLTGKESELEVLQFLYPESVLSFGAAYYYYDLTDVVPEQYDFVTARNARRITDERVKQYYVSEAVLRVGMCERVLQGERLRIYDLERMVIETARMKCSLPPDFYKEIVLALRAKTSEMVPAKIGDYLENFPKRETIVRIIDEEIF